MDKILDYNYKEKASYTEEELLLAREMFDKPEKFALLRKILQCFTQEEKGISIPSREALISKRPDDLANYGLQVAIESLADEKIRQALVSFYLLLKKSLEEDNKAKLEALEKEKFEEEQRSEKFKEDRDIENRRVGERL